MGWWAKHQQQSRGTARLPRQWADECVIHLCLWTPTNEALPGFIWHYRDYLLLGVTLGTGIKHRQPPLKEDLHPGGLKPSFGNLTLERWPIALTPPDWKLNPLSMASALVCLASHFRMMISRPTLLEFVSWHPAFFLSHTLSCTERQRFRETE